MLVELDPGSTRHKQVLNTWIFMLVVLCTEEEMFHALSQLMDSSDVRPTCCFRKFQELLFGEFRSPPQLICIASRWECHQISFSVCDHVLLRIMTILGRRERTRRKREKWLTHSSFMNFPDFDCSSDPFLLQGNLILSFT